MFRLDQIVSLMYRCVVAPKGSDEKKATERRLLEEYPVLSDILEEIDDDAELLEALKTYNQLSRDKYNIGDDPLLQKILMKIHDDPSEKTVVKTLKLRHWLTAVAACVALLIGAVLWMGRFSDSVPDDVVKVAESFSPGGNMAILSLSDGRTVQLDAKSEGIVDRDGLRYEDGSLVLGTDIGESNITVTLTVPRGGQYQVVLSDGTRVWINADSELSYPRTFSGATREVKLQGEAYFEVAKDARHPFIVKTASETVEVIGTQFNVNAYKSDRSSAVALVEGKVKVSVNELSSAILRPGQQSVVTQGRMSVHEVNIDECLAWKNNEFMFNDESLASAMHKIGRWYDLDITVDRSLDDVYLWGSLPRNENFGQVIRLIKLTNDKVKVEIDGRRVKLMK